MEIWQYIEVLKQPRRSWLFYKNYKEEKLNALMGIANEGHPGLICALTRFIKDENKEIREETCKTIICLFKKIDSKKGYYDTLKHCEILKTDIDYYEANFPIEQYVELLAIGSLNGNGYVREKAIEKLSQIENPRAIQFLIYRLADWVFPVRQAALKGIENYKSIKYIDNLIEYLPMLEWLQEVERVDLTGAYKSIIEFIVLKNRNYVIANFKKYPDKLRLLLAKHISSSLTGYNAELTLFISDKHFLIRNLAIDHFSKLKQSDIDHLLNDKSAKVRLQILYCLKNQGDFKTTIQKYLADNSASIRYLARFTLQQSKINFADYYNQNLQNDKQVAGSLMGIAEVEAKQYSGTVKIYLHDNRTKIKKVAFLALRELDKENAYEYALLNLNTSFVGLRNAIIDFLSHVPTQEVLMEARKIYKTENYELRKSMLKLFNKIGGWIGISDLLIATIDENENIRQMALRYLQIWKTKAVRLFTIPKKEEIEKVKLVFNFVHATHENKKYFKPNPLDGLDFYFNDTDC